MQIIRILVLLLKAIIPFRLRKDTAFRKFPFRFRKKSLFTQPKGNMFCGILCPSKTYPPSQFLQKLTGRISFRRTENTAEHISFRLSKQTLLSESERKFSEGCIFPQSEGNNRLQQQYKNSYNLHLSRTAIVFKSAVDHKSQQQAESLECKICSKMAKHTFSIFCNLNVRRFP